MHSTIAPASRLLIVLLVLGLGVIVGGCSASQENQETEEQDTSTTATGPHSADSIIANDPSPAPPPGTAQIEGSVLSCKEEGNDQRRCEIDIESVTAYGASTPPLATGARTVVAARSVFSSRSVDALTSAGTLTMTLEHSGDQPQMGQSSNPSPPWRLVKASE